MPHLRLSAPHPPDSTSSWPEAPAPWVRPDPLGQRVVLTLVACTLIMVLPFGPNRFWLAAVAFVVQALSTAIVRRRSISMTQQLGTYLVVEHALMLMVVLVAPAGYLAISIVAVGSLGSNSNYLPAGWHRTLAALTFAAIVGPPLLHDVAAGSMVVGAGLLMVAHIAFNRSGTLVLAEEVAMAAQHQADHDSLTGLANRRVLRQMLDDISVLGDASDEDVSLLLLDIDDFKQINDTHGHDIGDRVLCEVAARLTAIDESVRIVRLGGDEFAAVVPGDVERCGRFATSVVESLRSPMEFETMSTGSSSNVESPGPDPLDINLSITPSIGMAHTSTTSADSLLRCADVAMYDAKRDGSGMAWFVGGARDVHGEQPPAARTDARAERRGVPRVSLTR